MINIIDPYIVNAVYGKFAQKRNNKMITKLGRRNKEIAMARQIQRKGVNQWDIEFSNSIEKCLIYKTVLSNRQRIHWKALQKKYFPDIMKTEVQTKLRG